MPRSASEDSLISDAATFREEVGEGVDPPSPASSPERSRTSAAYSAVMGRASQLLPSGFVRRRAVQEPAAPPICATIRRLEGGNSYLELAGDVTLEALLGVAGKITGSSPTCFSLAVEEERGPAGIKELLKTTATKISHRRRLGWTLMDGVNWLLLPESVTREVRGTGILSWVEDHIAVNLREPLDSDSLKVTVELLGLRRVSLVLPPDATLSKLGMAVATRAGVPQDRQRLILVEQRPPTPGAEAFWAAARALLVWLAVMLRCLGLALGVIDPRANAAVTLHLQTARGRRLRMDVTRDLTLHQIEALALSQHGEEVDLGSLVLAPRETPLETSASSQRRWSPMPVATATIQPWVKAPAMRS